MSIVKCVGWCGLLAWNNKNLQKIYFMKLAKHICSNMIEIIGSSLILDDAAIEAEDWWIGSLSEAMSTEDDAIKWFICRRLLRNMCTCKICLGLMRLVKYQKG